MSIATAYLAQLVWPVYSVYTIIIVVDIIGQIKTDIAELRLDQRPSPVHCSVYHQGKPTHKSLHQVAKHCMVDAIIEGLLVSQVVILRNSVRDHFEIEQIRSARRFKRT